MPPALFSQNRYKMLSYRRQSALQGALVLAKSGRLELGDNILRTLQPLWHNWPAKLSNFVEKRKIRAITPFKVIDVRTNRKSVCDFLLVINTNLHPISYRFGVIVAYCSNLNTLRFLSPHLGLTDNVRCSSWARRKARSGLPNTVVLTELFLLGIAADAKWLSTCNGSDSCKATQIMYTYTCRMELTFN